MSARSGTSTPNSSEPKRGARFGLGLEEVFDLLIDRQAAGPTGRRVRTALDVARIKLDACQQAADAAHVAVAVAADLVAHAVQNERAVFERLQRLQALFKGELFALFIGPEGFGHDAVGAEHHHQPLLAGFGFAAGQTGQVEHKRQRRRRESQISQKLATIGDGTVVKRAAHEVTLERVVRAEWSNGVLRGKRYFMVSAGRLQRLRRFRRTICEYGTHPGGTPAASRAPAFRHRLESAV